MTTIHCAGDKIASETLEFFMQMCKLSQTRGLCLSQLLSVLQLVKTTATTPEALSRRGYPMQIGLSAIKRQKACTESLSLSTAFSPGDRRLKVSLVPVSWHQVLTVQLHCLLPVSFSATHPAAKSGRPQCRCMKCHGRVTVQVDCAGMLWSASSLLCYWPALRVGSPKCHSTKFQVLL